MIKNKNGSLKTKTTSFTSDGVGGGGGVGGTAAEVRSG